MTTGIVVKCAGPCEQEVSAAECDSDGWCTLCRVMQKVAGDYLEYKRLWQKRARYAKRGVDVKSVEDQVGHVVKRIARTCHAVLPVRGAIKLVNEICENARAEVEGYDRILTVKQALVKKPSKEGQREAVPERKSPGGVYLPGH